MAIWTSYLTAVFDPKLFKKSITKAKLMLRGKRFEAFAVSGNSGVLMGGAFALALKKKLILVRKKNDNSHSGCQVEGDDACKSFMFLDDFISTGATRRRVLKQVADFAPKCKFVGSYLYCDGLLKDANHRDIPPRKKPVVKKTAVRKKKVGRR